MAKKAKIDEIQTLRGLAFLAVVLQHAIGHYAYVPEAGLADGTLLGVWLILAKFAVPMFIFITGLVLFYNYPEGVPYGPFLLKRFKDIVLPYLLWSLIYAFFFGGIQTINGSNVLQILHDWATGKASYHLWYVVMVIQLYVCFPFVQKVVQWVYRMLNYNPGVLRFGFILLCVGYVWLTGQIGEISRWMEGLHVPLLTPLFTEYADRNAFYFFIYFLLGAAAGLNFQQWKQRLWNGRYGWMGLYAIVSSILMYRIMASFGEPVHIQYNATLLLQPFMAVFLLVSVLAVGVIAIAFHQKAGSKPIAWMAFIGQYSYGAYLAHAFMLTFSTAAADWLLPDWNMTLRTAAAFALCSVLSLLLAMLLGRFRIGRLLTGAPAPRKANA